MNLPNMLKFSIAYSVAALLSLTGSAILLSQIWPIGGEVAVGTALILIVGMLFALSGLMFAALAAFVAYASN